jgi:GxxExxY protein
MSIPMLTLDAERPLPMSDERHATSRLVHEQVTGRVLAAFFAAYRELGYGFAASVYLRALVLELSYRGVPTEQDVPLGVFYKGRKIGVYKAAFVVEGKVMVEVSTGAQLLEASRLQLLNCMRCSSAEVGMLLHFGPKPEFRRLLGRSIVEQGPASTDGSGRGQALLL